MRVEATLGPDGDLAPAAEKRPAVFETPAGSLITRRGDVLLDRSDVLAHMARHSDRGHMLVLVNPATGEQEVAVARADTQSLSGEALAVVASLVAAGDGERHVKTPGGEKVFHAPIGSIILPNGHVITDKSDVLAHLAAHPDTDHSMVVHDPKTGERAVGLARVSSADPARVVVKLPHGGVTSGIPGASESVVHDMDSAAKTLGGKRPTVEKAKADLAEASSRWLNASHAGASDDELDGLHDDVAAKKSALEDAKAAAEGRAVHDWRAFEPGDGRAESVNVGDVMHDKSMGTRGVVTAIDDNSLPGHRAVSVQGADGSTGQVNLQRGEEKLSDDELRAKYAAADASVKHAQSTGRSDTTAMKAKAYRDQLGGMMLDRGIRPEREQSAGESGSESREVESAPRPSAGVAQASTGIEHDTREATGVRDTVGGDVNTAKPPTPAPTPAPASFRASDLASRERLDLAQGGDVSKYLAARNSGKLHEDALADARSVVAQSKPNYSVLSQSGNDEHGGFGSQLADSLHKLPNSVKPSVTVRMHDEDGDSHSARLLSTDRDEKTGRVTLHTQDASGKISSHEVPRGSYVHTYNPPASETPADRKRSVSARLEDAGRMRDSSQISFGDSGRAVEGADKSTANTAAKSTELEHGEVTPTAGETKTATMDEGVAAPARPAEADRADSGAPVAVFGDSKKVGSGAVRSATLNGHSIGNVRETIGNDGKHYRQYEPTPSRKAALPRADQDGESAESLVAKHAINEDNTRAAHRALDAAGFKRSTSQTTGIRGYHTRTRGYTTEKPYDTGGSTLISHNARTSMMPRPDADEETRQRNSEMSEALKSAGVPHELTDRGVVVSNTEPHAKSKLLPASAPSGAAAKAPAAGGKYSRDDVVSDYTAAVHEQRAAHAAGDAKRAKSAGDEIASLTKYMSDNKILPPAVPHTADDMPAVGKPSPGEESAAEASGRAADAAKSAGEQPAAARPPLSSRPTAFERREAQHADYAASLTDKQLAAKAASMPTAVQSRKNSVAVAEMSRRNTGSRIQSTREVAAREKLASAQSLHAALQREQAARAAKAREAASSTPDADAVKAADVSGAGSMARKGSNVPVPAAPPVARVGEKSDAPVAGGDRHSSSADSGRSVEGAEKSTANTAVDGGDGASVAPPAAAPAASEAFTSGKQEKLGEVNRDAVGSDPERFTPKTTLADGHRQSAGDAVRDEHGSTGTVAKTYQTHSAVKWASGPDAGRTKTVHNGKLNSAGAAGS